MDSEDVLDQIERADIDSNGHLTREELIRYFKETGQDLSIVDDWFKWFDLDNKGIIEAEDVCTTLGISMRKSYADRVKANQERRRSSAANSTKFEPEKQIDFSPEAFMTSSISRKSSRSSSSNSSNDGKQRGSISSASRKSQVGSSSAADLIEEASVKAVHSAPPVSVDNQAETRSYKSLPIRSSTEDLRGNFEILHEEEVDETLLKDIMKIVKNNEDRVKEEKDMAKLLKDGVEEKHGKHWQAIVAYTNLGCNVEHEVKTFVYLRRANHIYILFRTPICD